MDIDYCNNKLKKIFSDWGELKKCLNIDWVKKLKRYYDSLEVADTFEQFLSTSLDHPEPLVGYDKPTWTLRISANVRFAFELDNKLPKLCKKIIVKGVFDDHGTKYNWYIS